MTLGVTCGRLREELGRFLGFSRDPADWSSDEVADVWLAIDDGLRQFYYPPRIEGQFASHQWSFLRPVLTIPLVVGVDDYVLPADFSSLVGGIYFVDEDLVTNDLTIVNEARIMRLRQEGRDSVGPITPTTAAIAPIRSDGISEQTFRLMLWPRPDQSYTITFQYIARQPTLRVDSGVPLGGPEHASTIIASCIAAADARFNDEVGAKHAMFMQRLQASVDFDRRANAPQTLGYNSDPGMDAACVGGELRSLGGLVTLAQYPLPPDGGEGEPPADTGMVTQEGGLIVTQGGEPVVPQ